MGVSRKHYNAPYLLTADFELENLRIAVRVELVRPQILIIRYYSASADVLLHLIPLHLLSFQRPYNP